MQNDTPGQSAPSSYTRTAKLLHWGMAFIILINLAIGMYMEHFPGFKHTAPEWNSALFYHASIGSTIFMLAIVRIGWRISHRPPPLPTTLASWQRAAAHTVHTIIYLLMLALPVSGYLHRLAGDHPVNFFGLFSLPILIDKDEPLRVMAGTVHIGLAFLLIGLLLVHFAAVIKHRVIDRDQVLQRMLP